jgi:hypothetical protein
MATMEPSASPILGDLLTSMSMSKS